MHTKHDLKQMGEKLLNWHNGMDSVYAVGSFFLNGNEYPDIDVVKRAEAQLARLIPQARKRLHGWGPEEVMELNALVSFLKRYVAERMGTKPKSKAYSKDGLAEMFLGYVETALAEENGDTEEPLNRKYGPKNIARESLAKMRRDVESFYRKHAADIGDKYRLAGYMLWMDRNGAGVGFDDGRDWSDAAGERLSKAAQALGETHIYVGDNGKIYVS